MALPLKWFTDKPVWVDLLPITKEKLQALEQVAQEQLEAQHRIPLYLLFKKKIRNQENLGCQ